MLTTRKIDDGVFETFWNGKQTQYRIINGSRGLSGRLTENVYGIVGNGNVSWIGTLYDAKQTVALWLRKELVT